MLSRCTLHNCQGTTPYTPVCLANAGLPTGQDRRDPPTPRNSVLQQHCFSAFCTDIYIYILVQDEAGDTVDWTKEGAGQTYDPTDAGDFDLSEDS